MNKRILSVLLALTLLALAACSAPSTPAATTPEEQTAAPTWQEQYDLGLRLLSEGNYEEAIIAFTAAIEIDPKQAPAYVGRGDAYFLTAETEETTALAQTDYEVAIELDNSCVEGYLGLSEVYVRQNLLEQALELLRQALERINDARLSEKLEALSEEPAAEIRTGSFTHYQYDADDNLIHYSVEHWDEAGFRYRIDEYDAEDNLINYALLHRKENGTNAYIELFNADGTFRIKYEQTEDERGRPLYLIGVEEGQNFILKIVAVYNDSGNLIGADSFYSNGELFQSSRYENGRTVSYFADGSIFAYIDGIASLFI